MSSLKKAWAIYMVWCHLVGLVTSASIPPPPPAFDPPSAKRDILAGEAHSLHSNQDSLPLDISTLGQPLRGNFSFDLSGWRPFLNAEYAPSLDGIPQITRHEAEEVPKVLTSRFNGDVSTRQVVPFPMAFLGSIGGILGILQFAETWGERIGKAIRKATTKNPHNGQGPSWTVAVQVGLDTAGLKGAEGNFPQVCLYDAGARLLGYTNTEIRIKQNTFWRTGGQHHQHFEMPRPEGMPDIQDGGIQAVGVWPFPGKERDLGTQQAPYITVIKRHYDAICVAGIFVTWPDGSKWVFDGSWARASDQSWYYSHIFDERSGSTPGECFWLDHRGTLDHSKDREEEYVHKDINRIGVYGPAGIRKDYFPSWLWASDVKQEEGLPTGGDLTDGMKQNGVDKGRTPYAVKIFLPAFKASNYQSMENVSMEHLTGNPAKLRWINAVDKWPHYPEQDLVIPFLHPNDEWRDLHARLVTARAQVIDGAVQNPPACMTDWYYDENDHLVNPADRGRCQYKATAGRWHGCRDKHHKRDSEGREKRPKTIKQHFSRSLVMDKMARKNGTSTTELCGHNHSVGPSYANHLEGQFCRMTDKTLWPFCDTSKGVHTNCFDGDAEVLFEENAPLLKREAHWDSIEHWNGDGKWKRNLEGDGELVKTR